MSVQYSLLSDILILKTIYNSVQMKMIHFLLPYSQSCMSLVTLKTGYSTEPFCVFFWLFNFLMNVRYSLCKVLSICDSLAHSTLSFTYSRHTVHKDTCERPAGCNGALLFLRDLSRAPDVWELLNHENLPLPLMVQHGKDSRSGYILMNNPKMYLVNYLFMKYFHCIYFWVTHKKGFSQRLFCLSLQHDMHISGAIDCCWFDYTYISFLSCLAQARQTFFQVFFQQKSSCKNFCCRP